MTFKDYLLKNRQYNWLDDNWPDSEEDYLFSIDDNMIVNEYYEYLKKQKEYVQMHTTVYDEKNIADFIRKSF